MKLDHIIETYLTEQEWDDITVERNEENETSEARVTLTISNQSFRLFIEGDEKREMFFVYLYAPFKVLEGKTVDACMLFNFLNDHYIYRGKMSVMDDGSVRYVDIIDLEKLEPCTAMIDNMLNSGISLFRSHIEAIAAVALTNKTYEAIREEYDKKAAIKEAHNKSQENEENGNTEEE